VRKSLAFLAFLPLLVLGASRTAYAQVATTPDEALSNKAKELFAKGTRELGAGQWGECRADLLAAFGLGYKPSKVAGNLAMCEEKLKLYRDAAEHIALFLSKPLDSPASGKETARIVLVSVSARVVTVNVKVDVAGAKILVDGKVVDESPLTTPVFVDRGPHRLAAAKVGFTTREVAVDGQPGDSLDVSLTLTPPNALSPAPPPPVQPPTSPPPPVPLQHAEPRPKWPFIVSGIAGVAGLAIGAGLTVAANGKSNDAATTAPATKSCAGAVGGPCQTIADDLNAQTQLARGAVAAFVLGGAFVGASVGLAVWSFGGKADVQVAPTVGGMTFRGTW
jgi:hypothetical protein